MILSELLPYINPGEICRIENTLDRSTIYEGEVKYISKEFMNSEVNDIGSTFIASFEPNTLPIIGILISIYN